MFHTPPSRQPVPLWARLALLLSFLAVFSALVAPASMLAEEVRTGKLGGVCNMAASAASGAADANAGDAGAPGTPSASHCDLCGTPGFALAGSPALATGCAPVQQVALLELRSPLSAAVPGLPFGRGPPSFLN